MKWQALSASLTLGHFVLPLGCNLSSDSISADANLLIWCICGAHLWYLSYHYRFFFKTYLEDVGEFLEECSLDDFVLPLFQGKIIGRVERID